MIRAGDLRVGDLVLAQAGIYTIEIVADTGSRPDPWGRTMVTYQARIVAGCSCRVGDSGEVVYGPDAELFEPGELPLNGETHVD